MDTFKQFDIATAVTDSLIDVFDKMLSMKLQLSDDESLSISEDKRVVGSVSVGGMVMGSIIIQVSEEFAQLMTASMTGLEPEEVGNEELKDVISELCNIVGGYLKSSFCDAGLICDLSPPSFTTGNDFQIEPLNTVRHERYVFSHREHPVIVEVGVRRGDATDAVDKKVLKPDQYKPIDINQLKDFDINAVLIDSITELFDTMLSMKIEVSEKDSKSGLDGDRVVGSVGFVGPLMGGLNIYATQDFSRRMTAAMSGLELEEIEEADIKDVISELCNIVGGSLKSNLCDSGLPCELSTPSLTTGTDFKIESQKMVRYERIAFRHQEDVIFVEIGAQNAESSRRAQAEDSAKETGDDKAPQKTDSHEVTEGAAGGTILAAQLSQKAVDDLIATTPSDEEAAKYATDTLDEASQSVDLPEEPQGDLETGIAEENLNFILDIPLELTVELGRTKIKIKELIDIDQGSVIEFSTPSEEPVGILANRTLIAKGEVVVEKGKYGVRIIESIGRKERLQSLR